jgi:hypothetical protein
MVKLKRTRSVRALAARYGMNEWLLLDLGPRPQPGDPLGGADLEWVRGAWQVMGEQLLANALLTGDRPWGWWQYTAGIPDDLRSPSLWVPPDTARRRVEWLASTGQLTPVERRNAARDGWLLSAKGAQ